MDPMGYYYSTGSSPPDGIDSPSQLPKLRQKLQNRRDLLEAPNAGISRFGFPHLSVPDSKPDGWSLQVNSLNRSRVFSLNENLGSTAKSMVPQVQ